MSSTYGENLKLSIFGQSHGPAIGMTLDGIPAGLPVNTEKLQHFLNRRAPGQSSWSTPRCEEDQPDFLGGVLDGYTCGAPLAAVIYNHNTRSADYSQLKDSPRPGHADYTAQIKYGGFQDAAGGGHFSGRLTAPLCIAGGLCLQWLEEMGISIGGHILSLADVQDKGFDPIHPELASVRQEFPVLSTGVQTEMQDKITAVKESGDSIGGTIECAITGLDSGVGEPMFSGVESKLAQILFGIPAVKGVQFGKTVPFGSKNNDPFVIKDDIISTRTNHSGGILGGITTGMPVIFQVNLKPTPSISLPQDSISLKARQPRKLMVTGRHDPCILPRAVPVVEAAAAIAILDLILGNTQTDRRKPL